MGGARHRGRWSDSGGLVDGFVYGSPNGVERSSSFTFELSATNVWPSRDLNILSPSYELDRPLRSSTARLINSKELAGLLVSEAFLCHL